MKKHILLFILSVLVCTNSFSQAFQWANQQTGGSAGSRKVVADQNGNSYFLGTFAGSIQFNTTQGQVTFTSQGQVSPNNTNIFVLKSNSNGVIEWARQINGPILGLNVWDNCFASITLDNNGSLIVCGKYNGTISAESNSLNAINNFNGFVAKYSCITGSLTTMFSIGDSGFDEINAITAGNNGNYYIAGKYTSSLTLGNKSITNSGIGDYYAGFDNLNNCIWLVNGNTGNRPKNIVINKQNTFQAFISFEEVSSNIKSINLTNGSIVNLPNNPSFIGTSITSIDTDNNGNILATGIYASGSPAASATVAGQLLSSPISGYYNIVFLCSMNSTGQTNWSMNTGASSWNNPGTNPKLSTDENNNIILSNAFSETATLDVNHSITSSGATDILITNYKPNGSINWTKQPFGGYYDQGSDICTSVNGNIFIAGNSVGLMNFDGLAINGANGNDAALLVKLNTSINTLGINQQICKGGILDVPFVANDNFNSTNIFTAELSDVTGNFANAIAIGTLTANVAGTYTINATIPSSITSGSGYRIRVKSSDSYLTGTDNGTNLSITNSITLTTNISSTSVCAGTPISLTASGAQSYSWNNGISNSVTFTPIVSQLYTVIGIAANGCTAKASSNIIINQNPIITISASSTQLCSGGQVLLYVNGANNYMWNTGNTTSSINVMTSGTYNVIGTSLSNCTGTAQITIVVSTSPQITLPATQDICPNTTITLDAGSGIGYNYSWSNNLGNLQTATINSAGTYSVTITNADGCSSVASTIVNNSTLCTTIPCNSNNVYTYLVTSIPCIQVSGASLYQFKYEQLDANNNIVRTSTTTPAAGNGPYISSALPAICYNAHYLVSAHVYKNGVWGPYGAKCNISVGHPRNVSGHGYCGIEYSNLNGQMCGGSVTSFATNYRFKFIDVNDPNTVTPGILENPNACALIINTTPHLLYNKTYKVSYSTFVPYWDDASASVTYSWSPFGPQCTDSIHHPRNGANHGYCGIHYNSVTNQQYSVEYIALAQKYRLTFTRLDVNENFNHVAISSNAGQNIPLSLVTPSLALNASYSVTISSLVPYDLDLNGNYTNYIWSPEGVPCKITTGNVYARYGNSNETEIIDGVLKNNSKILIYPNPTKDIINITSESEINKIELYNYNGSLIKILNSAKESINLNDLTKGLYFIVITNKEGTYRERIIKE